MIACIFFELSESDFQEEYDQLKRPGSSSLDFLIMEENMDEHFSHVEPSDVDLPEIQLKEDRYLHIENTQAKTTVDLKKMGELIKF